MKSKRILLSLILAGMVMLFIAVTIHAEEAKIKDVIEMKTTAAFATHKHGIVMFSHGKHAAAKPEGYGIKCGECHHDKDNKPLNNLKPGDKVQNCIACHKKPDKPKKEPGMSAEAWQKLQLEYYYGAIHENCVGCHKKEKKGPVKCNECHPKNEKK